MNVNRLLSNAGVFVLVVIGGCTVLVGLDKEYTLAPAGHAGEGEVDGGSGSTGSVNTTECKPGMGQKCYSGPPGTAGLGLCREGLTLCNMAGTGFGECVGEQVPRVEECSTPDDESCDMEPACVGTHRWSKPFGDSGDQLGERVLTDHSGNVIIVGDFNDTVDFGGEPLTSLGAVDFFVVKLDPEGKHLLSKQLGGKGQQHVTSIAVTGDDSILMTGYFEDTLDLGGKVLLSDVARDVFVVKLDVSGDLSWGERYGDTDDQYGYGIAADDAGNVIMTGYFAGSINFGGDTLVATEGSDIFVVKFDGQGKHLWSKQFGAAGEQYSVTVSTDAERDIIIGGTFSGTLDFGGGPLANNGAFDTFITKLDESGGHVWSRSFGTSVIDECRDLVVDQDRNIIVVGDYSSSIAFGGPALPWAGGTDMFVVKLDASGEHLWSGGFGDADYQHARGVAVDPSGNIVLTGDFQGDLSVGGPVLTSAAGTDIFIAKLRSDGTHVWSKRAGDANYQEGHDVTTNDVGDVYATGYFTGILEFGGDSVASEGLSSDIFIVKLAP